MFLNGLIKQDRMYYLVSSRAADRFCYLWTVKIPFTYVKVTQTTPNVKML